MAVDKAIVDDDTRRMNSLAARCSSLFVGAVCALVAAPASAHAGHAATPLHIHVGTAPVDIGAIVFVALLGVVAFVQATDPRKFP